MNKAEKTLLENRLLRLKVWASNILKTKKANRTSFEKERLVEYQNCIKTIKGWLEKYSILNKLIVKQI